MKASVESGAPPHIVEVQVDEQFQARVRPGLLYRTALAALIHQQVEESCELAVVVTDDATLHELNLRYRGMDAPTDVLAFADDADDVGEADGLFIVAPDMPRYLGDVVISAQRAAEQARRCRRPLERELDLLLVHGILHLAGFDHVGSERRGREMEAWKRKILRGWQG